MNRLTFLVDGFNLYHAIAGTPRFRPYRWLDLRAVCEQFAGSKDRIEEIFWFTAYYPGKPDKRLRHQIYAAALREKGVTPVLGKFRRKDKYCAGCRQTFPGLEEKQTDVNIAIKLFQGAVEDRFDTACLISGDSDLVPAIAAVKATFPSKAITVIIPPGRRAEELKAAADRTMRMKEIHLKTCQLPPSIKLEGGAVLSKPVNW